MFSCTCLTTRRLCTPCLLRTHSHTGNAMPRLDWTIREHDYRDTAALAWGRRTCYMTITNNILRHTLTHQKR